ncbi:hypothetical protein J7K93_11275 [bacterium]|nr:hypothetical protein [bacterium]
MKRRISTFIAGALIFTITDIVYSQSVNLPLDHYAYCYFDRMNIKGALSGRIMGTKPFSRDKAAEYVKIIDSYVKAHKGDFSKLDLSILERLKGEFHDKLKNSKCEIDKKEYEPHFYGWKGKGSSFYADVVLGGSLFLNNKNDENGDFIKRAFYGAVIRGNVGELGIYSDARIFGETGNFYTQHYKASMGYPQSVSKDKREKTWDSAEAYLTYNLKGIRIEWGRQNIKWGYSEDSPLFLSGNTPSFDMLKIAVPISRRALFTYIHGELRSDYSHKWIAAHRLEILPLRGISIGINEAVVYGKRQAETAYLNPVIPYLIAEHTLGDRDNLCMGLDLKAVIAKSFKFYGELFIDDLFSPFDIFQNYWGNKLAVQAGVSVIDPLHLTDSKFTAEYTKIDPFVYTHHDSVNVFKNYTYGLGHYLRPNSDMILIKAKHRFSIFFQSAISLRQLRHGKGSIDTPHSEQDGESKNFLSGVVEKFKEAEFELKFQPRRDVYFSVKFIKCRTENIDNIKGSNISWDELVISSYVNW